MGNKKIKEFRKFMCSWSDTPEKNHKLNNKYFKNLIK